MENKRGFLLTEEVLKIVIAVIGLVFLTYFLVSFFSLNSNAKKNKEAVNTLEEVSSVISNLGVEEVKIIALQPQRWNLFGFVGEDKKPNSCSEDNCLCICDKVIGDIFDRQIKECDKNGACLIISNLKPFETFKIEPYKKETTNINIREVNGQIEITKIQ